MRPDLMDILVCPECKGKLDLAVEREDKDEIVAGILTCEACGATYPIVDGIPNMLPLAMRS